MTASREEYKALRDGRGFVELPEWTSITLTGTDRQTFLNNFCTNDVKRLAPGESCEAFFTNVKGKVLGYGLVDCRDEELVVITVPNQAALLIEHLDRYLIREDVTMRDTTAERAYFFVGPTLSANVAPAARWLGWKLLGRDAGSMLEVGAAEAVSLRQSSAGQGLLSCGSAVFNTLRIEAGTPLYGVEINAENLPQEVGRDAVAISFTKGCYLGQETVARIDALGHVNRQLVGVRFSGSEVPRAGTALTHEDAEVGRATSACFSPRLEAPLALAMVRRGHNSPGAKLESNVGEAEVVLLPL